MIPILHAEFQQLILWPQSILEQASTRKKLERKSINEPLFSHFFFFDINRKFIELCSEETPMVRRAVAVKIGVIEMNRF